MKRRRVRAPSATRQRETETDRESAHSPLVAPIHAEVVMNVVVGAAIVVIQAATIRGIIGHHKAVVKDIGCRDGARSDAILHHGDKGHPVPGIEGCATPAWGRE